MKFVVPDIAEKLAGICQMASTILIDHPTKWYNEFIVPLAFLVKQVESEVFGFAGCN